MYGLRDGHDDTGYCDTCAQAMIEDALRWRALVGCARVWVQGHAGLTPGSPYAPFEQPYAHVGVAFWTTFDYGQGVKHAAANPSAETEQGRRLLTTFADKAVQALSGRDSS